MPVTDQRMGTTKVQLCKWMGFVRVAYRSMGEQLIQKQKWLRGATLKPIPAWLEAHGTREPRAPECFLGSTGQKMSHPRSSLGLCLFQEVLLLWALLGGLASLREFLSAAVLTGYTSLERKESSVSGGVQRLPKAFELFISWAQWVSLQVGMLQFPLEHPVSEVVSLQWKILIFEEIAIQEVPGWLQLATCFLWWGVMTFCFIGVGLMGSP